MRYTNLFGKSLRKVADHIQPVSNRLLYQAGYIRESSSGRYYFLPLGIRVREKVCRIIADKLNRFGAQQIITPVLHPLELWEESNRDQAAAFDLTKVQDRRGAKFVLGGTAEEMIVDLYRKYKFSYRDLPLCLYQFSQKLRDELRARGGLLRAREFMMKDAYSFHIDKNEFDSYYHKMLELYKEIFCALGLETAPVAADNGYMGGDVSHEFIMESEVGESDYFIDSHTEEAIHLDIARVSHQQCNPDEELLALEIREAKRGVTIQAGVNLYGEPAWRQIKTVVYIVDESLPVLVSLRGDLDINEIKLVKALDCNNLRLATEEEVTSLGSSVGFVSPLKLKIKKVGDLSLKTVNNFYTGADEHHLDILNVNYGRDFEADILTDISAAYDGAVSLNGGSLKLHKGIEVGNIFQLGTHYSEKMEGVTYTDQDNTEKIVYMGCYGIGIDRTIAAIVEAHSDDSGIIWPASVAPFQVHIVSLCRANEDQEQVEILYQTLQENGIEVLLDDRDISAGIKFQDADLLGIPHRVIVSKKTLKEGKLEYKRRGEDSSTLLTHEGLLNNLLD